MGNVEIHSQKDNWLMNIFAVAIMIFALFTIGVLIDFAGQNPEIFLFPNKILD